MSPGRVIRIGDRPVGPGHPTYVIAELSANHGQQLDRAVELLRIAAGAGADAVKLQTYLPETMTIDCDGPWFRIEGGTPWDGRNLFDLYREALTPWEWTGPLKEEADALGVHLFSSVFDATSVEFLEPFDLPAYKIASFELVDLPLIERVAATGRPLILSTGMATIAEISQAVDAARRGGGREIALLHCNSVYPSVPVDMDLRTIPNAAETWHVPVGLSDHTLGVASAVAAVALGASIVEKHLTLSRDEPGPDASFSLEPAEFAHLVECIRQAELALGEVRYGPSAGERTSLAWRRSLFVVEDVGEGELLTERNVRSIRPGAGLPPAFLRAVLGRRAGRAIARGTPLSWDLLA